MTPPTAIGPIPNIIDVEWKLELSTQTSTIITDNLIYTIILKTNQGEDIHFQCGTQQLQDFVYKLKDLVRHCEKVESDLK